VGGIDEWLRKPAWFADAICDDMDLMFDPERKDEAVAVCRPCPVRGECLAGALARREPDGVWGGFTTKQRDELQTATDMEIPILLRRFAHGRSSQGAAS
jgi:hypothetical protein